MYNADSYNTATSVPIGARGYSKLQVSMLSRALLVASIGLIITCGIGFLFSYIYSISSVSVNLLTGLSSIFIIVSIVCTFIWMTKIQNASNLLSFGTIALYCFANGIGFGALFYLLDVQEIMIVFGAVGVIFFGTWFFSTVISTKFMMSFGKFLMIATLVYFAFNIGMFLFNFFNIFGMRYSSGIGFEWMYFVSSLASGLLSIGYLAYNMYNIQKMDKFLDSTPELKNKYAVFFGFTILMSLISIIWMMARILLFSRR